jgi:hypothetical protein
VRVWVGSADTQGQTFPLDRLGEYRASFVLNLHPTTFSFEPSGVAQPYSPSLRTLLEHFDKQVHTRTPWSRRPISPHRPHALLSVWLPRFAGGGPAAQLIPLDLIDLLDEHQVFFYDGCLVAEVRNYRAGPTPEVRRLLLRPSPDVVSADLVRLLQAAAGNG